MANMLDDRSAIIVANHRQFEIRHPFAQSIHAENPLFDGLVPVLETQSASDDFTRQNLRRSIRWNILRKLLFYNQIAKTEFCARDDTLQCRIVKHSLGLAELSREKVAQPFFFDGGCEIQHDI